MPPPASPISPVDPGCVFCKIVAGQIPSYKIHEDDRVFVFLDIGPLSRGHCMIIPKAHYARLELMPAELAACCAAVAPRIARAILAAVGGKDWNLLQNNGKVAGQVVEHVHFHIIPRAEGDGLGYRWPAGTLAAQEGKALQAAVIAGL